VTGLDKVGATEVGTGSYNVKATTDSIYQDYELESIIPAESDISDGNALFKIKVTPRTGRTPANGKLYFKLKSAYAGDEDISFNGTVSPTGNNDAFVPRPDNMPYIAGTRAEGLEHVEAVAELTSDGATLEVGIYGYNVDNSAISNFIRVIIVEYAWVDEAV
jgi:hypothetical protein